MYAPLISPVQIDVQELMDFVDKDSLSQVRTYNLKGNHKFKKTVNLNHKIINKLANLF
jgi:hypothetical protein